MDNTTTPSLELVDQAVDSSIEQRQKNTLQAAQVVPGVSETEAAASRVRQTAKADELAATQGSTSVALESLFRTGSDMNASGAIIREVQDRTLFMDDPNWNPRKKPEQKSVLTRQLEQSGLPMEYWEAPLGASSQEAAEKQIEYAKQELESMQFIHDAGFAKGTVPMFAASMLDVDSLVGAGVFTKLAKARSIARAAKTGEKIGAVENLAANTMAGAEAGVTAALVTGVPNEELRPTMTAGDLWGSVMISAGLGSGLGQVAGDSLKSVRNEQRILRDAADSTMDAAQVASMLRQDLEKAGVRSAVDMPIARKMPRGVKNNNPGNIDFHPENNWQGQVGKEDGLNARFAKFQTPEDGIRAMHKVLTKYGQRGIDTVREIVSTYAPSSENNTEAYIKKVAKDAGLNPDDTIDLNDVNTSERIITAMIRHEQGGDFYSPATIREGINRSVIPDYAPVYNRSVGAAGLERKDVQVSPTTAAWNDRANFYWEEQNPGALKEYYQTDDWGPSPIQQTGKHFQNMINKTPFKTDYDRLRLLGSPVADMVNHMLLESPLGIARNRRSANNLSFHMYEEVAKEVSPNLAPLYRQWTKDNEVSLLDSFRDKHQMEFMRQVQMELETRRWEGQSMADVHPAVKQMADNFDTANQKMLHYAQGKDGAPAVKGMEDVEFKSGWYRRKWRADKMSRIEAEVGTDRILHALTDGMTRVSDIDQDIAAVIAKAIVRRTKEQDTGAAFGAFGSVGNDGKAFIAQALKDHAPLATDEEILATVDKVFGLNPERGKAGFARSKMDIDMRTPIPGSQYKLMDLIENDVTASQERYYRSASNLSALARKGIQREDIPSLRTAIIEEARAAGTYTEGTGKFVDDVFSYFGDGAYAGGAGPVVGRLNKLAIMSYLGSLGITQLAEVGAMMGVSGIKSFTKYAGKTIPEMLRGKDPEALRSLQSIGVYTGDHRLVVRAITMDDMDLDTKSQLLRGIDRLSDKGMRAMGYISGFYKVTEIMNTMAALTGQDYIVRSVRDGKNLSRLKDMGVDEEFASTIKRYIDNGTVEFDADGMVKDMHYESWAPRDSEDAALAIKTHVRQVVQKPQRGETGNWMHGQIGSFFLSLKNFTIVATQKQMMRNMRHADPEALMTLLFGTGTAAIAWSARQALAGTLDDKSPADIATGAIQWGNMTAPALQIIDPLTYLLGADRIPGSPFPLNDWKYSQQGLMSMPAGLSAVNQLAGIPRIPSDLMDDGSLGRESINAIKALPVIGRSYPMIPILKALEKD